MVDSGMISCKLCGGEWPKLAKAHIIPRSFYGMTVGSANEPARILSNKPFAKSPRSQVGEYDDELVCPNCEKYFSDLDNYAYRLLFLDRPETYFDDGKPLVDVHSPYDVEKFRQFVLSILWRMDATTRDAFSVVRLNKYAGRLREAVKLRQSSLAPFVDAIITRFDDPRSESILFPTRLRHDGVNGYRWSFAQHECWVFVDQRPIPSSFNEISISRHSSLCILRRDFSSSPLLRAMVGLVQANR
jgi:hypothetical protein